MSRVWRLPLLPSLAAVVLLSGCAGGTEATLPAAPAQSPVVAEFGGEVLTLAALRERYARSATAATEDGRDPVERYVDFLQRYVDFRLKVMEARRIGLHEDPELIAEINAYRDQLAQPFLLEREVLDGIIRDLYQKQKEEIAASHILVLVDRHAAPADTLAAFQRLSAIRDSILAGVLDFATAATRHSDDPFAQHNQGYLGYFTGGRMIYAFEQMAYNTPVGQLSPVFRSPFGYHVIYVHDRRPASPEIRAAHILIRLDPHAAAEDSVRAYRRMAEVQARLAAGEDFAAVAREVSEDPASAPQGGDLGYFGRDRMVEPFAEAAFALVDIGERSEIVRTHFGLHLIELTGRREPATLEQQYDALRRLAERLPRTQERRQAVGRAHRQAVGSTFDTTLVMRAMASYADADVLQSVLHGGFESYADSVFATIGDQPFTLADAYDRLRTARVHPAPDQRAQVIDLLDQILDEKALALAARGLEDRNPEFRRLMADYIDGVLFFRLTEDSVWTAAARDSVGLRAFYEPRAEQYRFGERRRVITLQSRSDSLMQVASALLAEGRTPADVLAALGAEEDRPIVRVDTVFLSSPSSADPFARAFDLEPGAFTEPIRHRAEHLILYLDGIEAPRQMTFEEARAHVLTDYQEELDRRLLERLRREAGLRLYLDRIEAALAAEAPALRASPGASDPYRP